MCNKSIHENFILNLSHTRYQQSIHFFNNKKDEKFLIQINDSDGNTKLSASVFLRKSDNGKCKLYCPRGPIFDEGDIQYFKDFLIKTEEIAKQYNATKIICNPLILNKWEEYLKNLGCEIINNPTKTMLPPNEIFIKSDNEKQMLAQMSKSCRKNIKKANIYGLKSVEIEDINNFDLDKFYELYVKTMQRKNLSIHDKQYFKDFLSNMDSKCLRFNKTSIEDEVVAMSIDYAYNRVLECIYSVSDSMYNDKKVNNMLHWGRMLYCINSKDIDYFLCGGVYCDKNDTSNKDYGVYQFKSSLCGGNIKTYIGDIIYNFKR